MKIKARLTFHYQNNDEAKIAFRALQPDNINYLESKAENNLMICEINGESLNSALATIDDLIFSEILVEKVLTIDKGGNNEIHTKS
jgi:hypothetical protein